MANLDSIYRQYADDVFRYLMCLCHDPILSEELTQETFYQAVKSIDRYNGQCKMSVWLCQIAKHSYYKYVDKKRKTKSQSLEDYQSFASPLTNPESELIEKEDKISFYRKIYVLENPYREVVLLRILGDLSFKEIGEIHMKTENWARVTYYRAKEKLGKEVDTDE
ncbi:RNA polymerase sigma factor [Fredinandcohnia sp. 179-A 10B2 NHS]|uniref:RNA polymerase sigma factor n=1 Tax=Fredinandcohnia sp. 179-A 10B2 NHS TaxID=3235176 RepID=UPI0039A2B1C9